MVLQQPSGKLPPTLYSLLAKASAPASPDPTLLSVLEALSLRRPETVRQPCQHLKILLKRVPWLYAALQQRYEVPLFEVAALDLLIERTEAASDPSSRVNLDWRQITLEAAALSTVAGIQHLGALSLLTMIDSRHAAASDVLPDQTTVEKLAESVRGLARRWAVHPDLPKIHGLDHAGTWSECGLLYAANLEPNDRDAWLDKWGAWLSFDFASKKTSAVVESPLRPPQKVDPPDAAPRHRPTRPPSFSKQYFSPDRTPVSIFWQVADTTKDLSPAEAPEDAVAGFPTTELPEPLADSHDPPVNRALARRLCFQATRAANSGLLSNHIDTLSNAEAVAVVSGLSQQFDIAMARGETSAAVGCAMAALVLGTGRSADRLAAALIVFEQGSEGTDGMSLDLEAGCLRQPVLRPENAFQASPEQKALLMPTQSWIDVPLPPPLIAICRRIQKQRPAKQIADWWPEGYDLDPEQEATDALKAIPGLSPVTASLARARRWLGPRLMDLSGDLAETMLICGDTFTRSSAPLYYYAPRVSTLQARYREAVWPTFGHVVPSATTVSENFVRIGSQAVPTDDVIAEAIATAYRHLQEAHGAVRVGAWPEIRTFHNRYVSVVVTHFCIVTTHRPHKSLARLRRENIDPDSRLALIDDKAVDAAHLLRPVALGERLASQIQTYIDHLAALSQHPQVPLSIRQQAIEALHSRKGLFFFCDQEAPFDEHTFVDTWRESGHRHWQAVPPNAYRHYFATHLREMGAEPLVTMIQCGHLEAAEQPFSATSPLSVIVFRDRMTPALDAFEAKLRLNIRKSPLTSAIPPGTNQPLVEPLRSWENAIDRTAAEVRKIERRALRDLARSRRSIRDEADALVLETIVQLSPPLHDLIVADHDCDEVSDAIRAAAEQHVTRVIIRQMVDRLRSAPFAPAVRASARDRLARRLRQIRIRHDLRIPELAPAFILPRAAPTSSITGGLLAYRQIQAFRQRFLDPRGSVLRESDPALFKTLALVIFGGIDTREALVHAQSCQQVLGVVTVRRPILLCADDVSQAADILGISGIAALACASSSSLDEGATTNDKLSQRLYDWAPDQFAPDDRDVALDRLLETVWVANRVGLSGLARFMVSDDGSRAASPGLQRALLVGGFPGLPSSVDAAAPMEVDKPSIPLRQKVGGPSRSALKEALRAFRRQVLMPLGNGSDDALDGRARTIDEVRKIYGTFLDEVAADGRLTIEYALLEFANRLAVHGTDGKSHLAVSTIATYVTSIGRDLIVALAGKDLRGIDADDLETHYLDLTESRLEPATRSRAARQCIAFHEILVDSHRLEPIDVAELASHLPKGQRRVRADAVTEAEYHAACQWLTERIAHADKIPLDDTLDRRLDRIARLVLICLYRSGARISEVTGMRHSDLVSVGDETMLLIRSNVYRGLKTYSARRRIDMGDRLSLAERQYIEQWIAGERLRLGRRFRSGVLLFPEREARRKPTRLDAIRQRIIAAFESAVGRHCWPHMLRHARANTELIARIRDDDPGAHRHRSLVAYFRQIRSIAVYLGQASITTTVASYLHLPWLLAAYESGDVERTAGRKVVSFVSARSLSDVDKIWQRAKLSPPGGPASQEQTNMIDAVLTRHAAIKGLMQPPPRRTASAGLLPQLPVPLVSMLDMALRTVVDDAGLVRVLAVSGLADDHIARIVGKIHDHADRAGIRVLSTAGSSSHDSQRRTPIPRTSRDPAVEQLPKMLDHLDIERRQAIAELFWRCDQPRSTYRDNAFFGHWRDIERLGNLLDDLGIKGLDVLRVVRRRSAAREPCTLSYYQLDAAITPFDRLRWILWVNAFAVDILGTGMRRPK